MEGDESTDGKHGEQNTAEEDMQDELCGGWGAAAGEDSKGELSRRKRTREDKSFVPTHPVVNDVGASPDLQDLAPVDSPAPGHPSNIILFYCLIVPAVCYAAHCHHHHQLVNFHS